MQINNECKINFNLDDRKRIIFKYFSKPDVSIMKINSASNWENLFVIYNENIKESLILLKLSTNDIKTSNYADFEIKEINLNLEESYPLNESNSNKKACKIFGVINYLEKLYIVNSMLSIFIIDLNSEEKKSYKLNLEKDDFENDVELCNYSAYAFVKPKIIFVGGLGKDRKINKNIYSFDISTYKYELNKVRENNFIERYRHGIYSDNLSYLYTIGGFTKILTEEQIASIDKSNSAEFICEKIQLIKFDNQMETYVDLHFTGANPKLIIDPYIQVVKAKYLFAFSKFKYEKIWYLDIDANNANEINLSYLNIPQNLDVYNGFFYTERENGFFACYPVYKENNDHYGNHNEKDQFSNKISVAEDEKKFNFAIRYLPMKEEKETN